MSQLSNLKKDLTKNSSPQKAKIFQWFFKTGQGEYGAGDVFLGLTSAEIKTVAKKYQHLILVDIQQLLNSKIHEERMTALRILVWQYQAGDQKTKKQIFSFYLKNAKKINNWDLVDVSAPNIVGHYLLTQPRQILYKLAKSKNLWEKRIAILATYTFIKHHDFSDTLKIVEILLTDKHDLIHKAVGWMLREVGKQNQKIEEDWLKKYYRKMPRTMLRYAIEKFPESKRKFYLAK